MELLAVTVIGWLLWAILQQPGPDHEERDAYRRRQQARRQHRVHHRHHHRPRR